MPEKACMWDVTNLWIQSDSLRRLYHAEHDYDIFSFEAGSVHLESDLKELMYYLCTLEKTIHMESDFAKCSLKVLSTPSEDISQSIRYPVEEASITVLKAALRVI